LSYRRVKLRYGNCSHKDSEPRAGRQVPAV